MSGEDFLLKWNDHHSLFFAGAEELCASEEYTDVTLAAGSKLFPAHKMVLSICSPYFRNLFRKLGSNMRPVIFLKDVKPKHLELLLQYMYKGEIKVEESELVTVLNTAQGLEIKGLTDSADSSNNSQSKPPPAPSYRPPPIKRPPPAPQHTNITPSQDPLKKKMKLNDSSSSSSDSLYKLPSTLHVTSSVSHGRPSEVVNVKQEVAPVTIDMDEEPEYDVATEDVGQDMGYTDTTVATGYEGEEGYEEEYYQDTGNAMGSMGEQDDRAMWYSQPTCPHCGKISGTVKDLHKHMLTHTEERPYPCRVDPDCSKTFKDPSNRLKHERHVHAGVPYTRPRKDHIIIPGPDTQFD